METTMLIKEKLLSIGEDYESLKPFMIEYLEKIESIISSKILIQEESLTTLKSNTFSVLSISKELKCSRTTLYNHNQLLKRYIEYSETLINQSNPFVNCDILRTNISDLHNQINKMIDRDISIEILKVENSELAKSLNDRNRTTPIKSK
ncbi:hypothetical protein LJE39_08740 [Clostridium butyricum]|uniref:hypothetical protein n=1 Tax=Clostridium butyricum TaxID=1492 RepID=UPI0021C37AA1|nr:hypothetical protein [Clostridium butyricum]MCQ2013246.1 hypothetical protein [Clostridium butyricum]